MWHFFFLSPPTIFQIVSRMAHRFEETFAFVLRLSREGNRRTPLLGESERVLAQLGHSTSVTPLSRKRWSSMETTPKNVHLGILTVCTCESLASSRWCSLTSRWHQA
jgi:hypothetical protein